MNTNYNEISKIVIDKEEIVVSLEEYKKLLNQLEKDTSFDEVCDLLMQLNKIRDAFLTKYWISYIGYLLNINDEKYLQSEKIMGELEPIMDSLKIRYYSIIIKSKFRSALENEYGSRLFSIAENEALLMSDNIADEITKEKALYKEYLNLVINTRFDFNGEELNLPKLNKYLVSDDRAMRKKAYNKRFEILLSLESDIDEIINRIIITRTKIAQMLGFSSYSQVGDIKMNRIGYGDKDIKVFREQVKKYIVPLIIKLREKQKERLGLDKLMYYDAGYLFNDGNAKVIGDLASVVKITSTILNEANSESGNLFDEMIKNGLIDLSDKDNKSNGGITTYLPDFRVPMFIKKYLGLDDNITSIHHEFGHSQQLFYSRDLMFHENRWPTFDICEIHSTAMEFLMYPYLEEYFGKDVNKYKIKHLTGTLGILVSMSITDEFQHFIYDNPNIKPEERKTKWLELCAEYYPERSHDHEYFAKGIDWQADSSRIDTPFYAIDYAIAGICGVSFYEKQKENEKAAWDMFIKLCKVGGSKSLLEIIELGNINNPFSDGSIKKVARILESDISNINVVKKFKK